MPGLFPAPAGRRRACGNLPADCPAHPASGPSQPLGEYAVVASLGGAPQHPVWYYNLKANPHVELQDGPVRKGYDAREVDGAEYQTWWERAVEVWPDYAEYAKKTTRTMPILSGRFAVLRRPAGLRKSLAGLMAPANRSGCPCAAPR